MIETKKNAPDFTRLQPVAEFREEWIPRSEYRGFSQVWRDPFTGAEVDFAQIEDPAELRRQSELAERRYLEWIEKGRKKAAEEGISELDYVREVCRNELYYLAKYVLHYRDMVFHLHYFMCERVRELERDFHGLFELPRDTFKSTIFGIARSLQLILQNPDVSILYLSSTKVNASRKVKELRGHFIDNGTLRALFGEHATKTRADEGSGSRWTTRARSTYRGEATLTASGIGSRNVSAHYDVIVCDDIWDEKSVSSRETMAKARAGFQGLEFLFRRNGPRIMLVIGTRFALDDLTDDIAGKGTFQGNITIVSGLMKNGRSLWPEGFSVSWMRDFCCGKVKLAEVDGSKYAFSCQVMLSPRRGDAAFSADWFEYGDWTEQQDRLEAVEGKYTKYILVDAACDNRDTSDPVAIITVAITHTGKCWVIDYLRDQIGAAKFVEKLEHYFDKHRPEAILRQKTSLETTIMTFINEHVQPRRKKEGKPLLSFIDYSIRKREKKSRISASLQPRFQSGTIIFDRDLPYLTELEGELLDHPTSSEDDGIDALSMLDDPRISSVPSWRPKQPAPEVKYGRTQQEQDAAEKAQRKINPAEIRKIYNSEQPPGRAGTLAA